MPAIAYLFPEFVHLQPKIPYLIPEVVFFLLGFLARLGDSVFPYFLLEPVFKASDPVSSSFSAFSGFRGSTATFGTDPGSLSWFSVVVSKKQGKEDRGG